ncbi:hypothetical protein JAAARDRAFT_340000 [Jaapia argillacea MUCL 33604]|uniref:Hemerythrin-like domain-containing protein n=1 Tax=Jaapia argillacea MUCL 33604 TaxID=933084 RepID=A0A067PJG2_9AGAM|nr:hypothetical protein JAAARDRAFT_340000 [Jaapia argillacea MUCL 33604]
MSYPLEKLPTIPDNLEVMDPAKALPYMMAFMKNTLIEGLSNVHRLAPQISSSHPSFKPFMEYIRRLCDTLALHFQADELFFRAPAIVKALSTSCCPSTGSTRKNLDKLRDLAELYSKTPSLYSPSTIRASLSFGPEMVKIMRQHICAVNCEKLSKIGAEPLRALILDNIRWFESNSDICFTVPFILAHHDPSTSKLWPVVTDGSKQMLPSLIQQYIQCWSLAPYHPITRQPQVLV